MIDGLRPYPQTKPTGLPWLGDVPAHWDVRRSKYVFREVDSRSTTGEETHLSMSQRLGLVPAGQVEKSLVSESYVGGKLVEKNDLVLNRLKAHLGVFAHAKQQGLISPDYTVLRPTDLANVRYFEFVLKSPSCRAELRTRAKGIVEGFWRLYTDDFYDIRVPVPTPDEQRLIVRFLDWHGVQTAKLIRTKKKLIALLNEQKQAIIHHAVTRGLDPNVELKPSGVPWLGDVPEAWKIAALRHRYDQCLGKMLDTKRITGSHLVPYLRNTDVQWESINVIDLPEMDIPPQEFERYTVRLGDLLVCEGGEVGRAAIWSDPLEVCGFQKALHRIRPRKSDLDISRFLLLQLRLAVAVGAFVDGHESTIAHLTGEKLRAHRFLFPPFEEQERIIEFVETKNRNLDRAISDIEHEIALVQEFCARLAVDVVTGKLDVRTAAASLPEITAIDALEDAGDVEDLGEAADAQEDEELAA